MDTRDLHEKGLKLRREIFGEEAVEQRTKAFGAFGEPLQHMINAYAYGDIWSRPALPLKVKSLAAIAIESKRTIEIDEFVPKSLSENIRRDYKVFGA